MAAAQAPQAAHIGYVYPAGGQAGTTLEVVIGGQGLARLQAVHVSGGGVEVKFLEHVTNYKRKYQEHLRQVGREKSGQPQKARKNQDNRFGPPPDHEMFTRLEDLSRNELRQVASKFATMERVQRNRQLDELVILEITIDEGARPGMRELRLLTGVGGATNPVRFMVSTLPEAREYEPNDLKSPPETHLRPPFVMNGQIMPGDEDRFSFDAGAGQGLVIDVAARELVPYLADAVPGWFQAVVAVLDDAGNEVAYADDFLFDPDPALYFVAPETGKYHIVVRDSIHRGREDFVYRVTVGELPFVTGIFPLGGRLGSKASVYLYGWNLPDTKMALDTSQTANGWRDVQFEASGMTSNTVRYALGTLPESTEKEGNGSIRSANAIKPQSTLNGRIDLPGDVDLYRFKARAGEVFKISVAARSLRSPVDGLLRVLDREGAVLAWNDDATGSGSVTDRTGMLTHGADPELVFTAPAKGTYYIQVSDSQNQGGETHAYRLSLDRPNPDFEVFLSPSAITVPGNSGGMATLHARRVDGFEGPIEVSLAHHTAGFSLSGGLIPAGQDSIPVVISRKGKPGADAPINYRGMGMGNLWTRAGSGKGGRNSIEFESLGLAASAAVAGNTVSKAVTPADEMTQAFIIQHLVPATVSAAFVPAAPRQLPSVKLRDSGPVELTAGSTVHLNARSSKLPENFSGPVFQLESAPPGVTLNTTGSGAKTRLELTADDTLEPGRQGNLVIGVYFEVTVKSRKGDGRTRTIPMGFLPAVPYRTPQ
jgi:hypothetical protein